ncbi:replication endonuclease [Yersinia enterocolitica]
MTALVSGGLPTPEQEQQFFDGVGLAFAHLPRFVSRRLAGWVISVYAHNGYGAAYVKFDNLVRRDLPVIEGVYRQYAINPDDLPGYIFSGLASESACQVLRSLSYRFNALVDGDDGDIQLLAQDIAMFLCAEMEHISELLASEDASAAARVIYSVASSVAEHFGKEPPEWKRFISKKVTLLKLITAISKMMGERYWLRYLRTLARRWREHLNISLGSVRRQASIFCSYEWVQHWMASRNRGRQLMAETELEDEETGDSFNLLDIVDNSISSSDKRRAELMTRVKGLENLAKFDGVAQRSGYVGLFFSLTAPSKYHAYLATGHRNPKWSGASPKDTQNYFTRLWRQIGSTFRRRGVAVFGLRISEPHHDATPHWHGILFVHYEQEAALCEIMEYYANREDAQELTNRRITGKNTRLEIKPIDESQGSASAYITKYIGRNIDGCADGGTDKETGQPFATVARHASAWASMWGIKQFQFIGGAPVSVWRELRRFRNQAHADSISPELGALHHAADIGDWKTYILLQGGPFVARRDLILRTWYTQAVEPNECGEYTRSIRGVYLPYSDLQPVKTRTRHYRVVKSGRREIIRRSALTPWTRVNNCILCRKQPANNMTELYLKIPIQLELDFGEVNVGQN